MMVVKTSERKLLVCYSDRLGSGVERCFTRQMTAAFALRHTGTEDLACAATPAQRAHDLRARKKKLRKNGHLKCRRSQRTDAQDAQRS